MAEFVVNLVLFAAILVLLLAWGLSSARRRRRARHEHREDRRAVLAALTGTLGPCAEDRHPDHAELDLAAADRGRPPLRAGEVGAGVAQLDQASLAALLDLLEERRRPRHGLISGLIASPRSVWSAGTRAGQTLAQRSTGATADQPREAADGALYREAAAELVDIHAHDPADASRQYAHYAAAVGDPRLAELYLRAAAYASNRDHVDVRAVLDQITGATTQPDTPPKKELSDGDASIDA
jgi:hypothetical protein